MGDSGEHAEIITILLSVLSELAAMRGWTEVLLSRDNFFAWIQEEPLVRVSPDVYLLDDPPPRPRPKMWQTWLPGHRPPRWAVEIVSDDWRNDYEEAPQTAEDRVRVEAAARHEAEDRIRALEAELSRLREKRSGS
ncbi:Uma2 family endonuclease [Chondromyces apiculatus]|nr:Uma2 family endonuclease [Chondromyces apiculatus]